MASQAQTTEQTEFFCETPHGPVPVSRPHQVRFLQQTLDLAFKILSHETTVRISAQFLDKSGDSPTNNFDEEIHYYDPTAEPSRFVADVRVFLGEIFKTIIFETSVKLSDGTDGERRVEDPYKIFIRHSVSLDPKRGPLLWQDLLGRHFECMQAMVDISDHSERRLGKRVGKSTRLGPSLLCGNLCCA